MYVENIRNKDEFLMKVIRYLAEDTERDVTEYLPYDFISSVRGDVLEFALSHVPHFLTYRYGEKSPLSKVSIKDKELKKKLKEELAKYKKVEEEAPTEDEEKLKTYRAEKLQAYKTYLQKSFGKYLLDGFQFMLCHAMFSENLYMLRLLIEEETFTRVARDPSSPTRLVKTGSLLPDPTLLHLAIDHDKKEVSFDTLENLTESKNTAEALEVEQAECDPERL